MASTVTNGGGNVILYYGISSASALGSSMVVGLMDSDSVSRFDTWASHPGWNEFTPGVYYSGSRPAWGQGTILYDANGYAYTGNGASPSVFAMIATCTVRGVFIAGSGWLISAGSVTPVTLYAGDTLVVYVNLLLAG